MPVAAVVSVASAAVNHIASNKSAKAAAGAQKLGLGKAREDYTAAYEKSEGYQNPYLKAGEQSIGQLSTGTAQGGEFNRPYTISDFAKDPGYDFRMREGQRAVDRSAAARGGALSGSAIKANQEFGQGLASQEYQSAFSRYQSDLANRYNRLSDVASRGQRSADVMTQTTTEYGDRLADNNINRGNVNAAKEVAYGKNFTQANNQAANAVGGYFSGGATSYGNKT